MGAGLLRVCPVSTKGDTKDDLAELVPTRLSPPQSGHWRMVAGYPHYSGGGEPKQGVNTAQQTAPQKRTTQVRASLRCRKLACAEKENTKTAGEHGHSGLKGKVDFVAAAGNAAHTAANGRTDNNHRQQQANIKQQDMQHTQQR